MYYLALHPSTTPLWGLCVDFKKERQTETSLIVLITVVLFFMLFMVRFMS